MGGLSIIPLIMGLFGLSEVFVNIEAGEKQGEIVKTGVRELFPSLQDWKDSIGAIFQGSTVGFFLGILPGWGYNRHLSPTGSKEKFRSIRRSLGRVPSKAWLLRNPPTTRSRRGSFIPLMVLGIPTNAVIAILMGALLIHGVRPGPGLIAKHAIFSGVLSQACTSAT
jgi:putative tricarboxylic transport membrane protein